MCLLAIIITFLIVNLGSIGYSQQKPAITYVAPPETDPTSGVQMYRTYCAVCHGVDGTGNGPAASELKRTPPDLTLIARRNGGQFPSFRVANIITGDAGLRVHGSREMPMWGNIFRDSQTDEVAKLRVHNLTQYIASIQQK